VSFVRDPRAPCLIGVAQHTWHPDEVGELGAPEPLDMWVDVCRAAEADCGASGVLAAAGSLDVVYCQSWAYDDPPGRLAAQLGISPRRKSYSGIGGTTPLVLVDEAAAAMLAGDLDVAVVVGAEALATKRRLKAAGEKPRWRHPEPVRSPFPFEAPFHPAEVAHEVFQAWLTFAVFDIARRAHRGTPPAKHARSVGELLAPLSAVAACNPHAWFRTERTAEELSTPSAANRLVGYPYTKTEVAMMNVDQAAAVIVATAEAADRLGVPAERRVWLRGWCAANDPVYVAEHVPMWASPAMRAASQAALSSAGVGIDDIGHLDLYSCFASSIAFACDALGIGIGADDDRPLSVTGGLPFAGGPGSNYLTHALAAMVATLRDDPGSLGLVSGVGMHLTKHVFGVLGTEPGRVAPPDQLALQQELDAAFRRRIVERAEGPATIAAYTVVHDRSGDLSWGLAVCDLPSGARCYARASDADLLARWEAEEWVGRVVQLVPGDANTNLVRA
jgi:acetyl-CoA C-acetyltransferase